MRPHFAESPPPVCRETLRQSAPYLPLVISFFHGASSTEHGLCAPRMPRFILHIDSVEKNMKSRP
jgi:hypothetical protein